MVDAVGPLAGALDGPPSLLSPRVRSLVGAEMIWKRCQLPFESPSESKLAALRNQSVA